MQIFNLKKMNQEKEDKQNVFYKTDFFKTRVINLEAGMEIPDCNMSSHVIFTVLEGKVKIKVNEEMAELTTGKCLVTEPATLSMTTETGAKIMGVQIENQ